MSNLLLTYGSEEGQTARITRHMARHIRERGHEVRVVNCRRLPPDLDLEAYDGIIVGGSVHVGKHQRYVAAFVQFNRRMLEQRPGAFFSVSLAAASDEPARQGQAGQYVQEFLQETGWHPEATATFGGALNYSQYDEVQRFVLRMAGFWGADNGAASDVEFTDWTAVEQFADEFLARVADHADRRISAP